MNKRVWFLPSRSKRQTHGKGITFSTRERSLCCDGTWQKQPEGERIYFGSRFQGYQSNIAGKAWWPQ